MSLTLRQLSPRQRDALRSALASLLERHFTFPAYFDYRRNALAHRPVDGGKRLEIIRYIQQTPLELDIPLDSAAMERWVAQTLLGFANANPSFTASRVPSLRHTLVRRARQAVADVTQYAGSGLLRDPPAPFPTEQSRTWLGALNSRMRPDA